MNYGRKLNYGSVRYDELLFREDARYPIHCLSE